MPSLCQFATRLARPRLAGPHFWVNLEPMREAEPHILFEKRGALGLVTLNRPKALNALTHGMCIGLAKALDEWARDNAVQAVAIRGAGPRAFCAGGDIRSLWESSRDKTASGLNFLRDEYRLNAAIAMFPKPYIALWHGIVMGGGAGVSVHGRYRLADASLIFAMPETGIGFVTDVGASFFLSRLPGETGMYLGLTGARIGRDDAQALGLATHAVDAADHDALIESLANGMTPENAIAPFVRKPAAAPIKKEIARIDRSFSGHSVEAILERLERDGSDFAAATAQILRTRSPGACKFTFRALREAKTLSLRDCLKMEYRIAARAVPAPDFREGVRAAIIDKDGKPVWRPAVLAGVSDADIAGYFASLGTRDLSFP
jgi:enoyl-CoA hydratase